MARRLLERGATVSWATVTDYFGDAHRTIAARIGDPRVRVLPAVPVTHDPRRKVQSFGDMLHQGGEYGRLLEAHLRFEVAAEAEHLQRIVQRERPDVVASDGLMQAAVIACELAHVPYVHVWTGLYPLVPARFKSEELALLRKYLPLRNQVYAQFGLAPRLCYGGAALSPFANTVFATEALVGKRLPPATHLVGPYRPAAPSGVFDWRWLDRRRALVYASFGSMLAPAEQAVRAIARATKKLGAQLIVGYAEDAPAPIGDDEDVRAMAMAPQWEILARAKAFVTHGGANSVMEALARGVPMLVAPQSTDQPVQAWFLKRAVLGRVVRAGVLEDERRMHASLQRLLGNATLHRRLARLATAAKKRDGADVAARIVLSAARR